MRCLGEIDGRENAERLVAHLLVNDISTHIESADGDSWEIWVREEDKLRQAVDELKLFQQDPHNARYDGVLAKAKQRLEKDQAKQTEIKKNIREVKMVVRPGMMSGRIPPLTLTLLVLCVVLGLLSNFGTPGPNSSWGRQILKQLKFVDLQESEGDPAANLKKGEVWRAVTPIFLHGSPMHLGMNMLGLVIFGRVIERLLGTPRYAVMILALAIVPNLLQGLMPESLGGNPNFVGISGVIYGLVGYVWVRSQLNPSFGISIPMPFLVLMIGSIVIGLSGAIEAWRFADLCHLGGLVLGAAMGYFSESKK